MPFFDTTTGELHDPEMAEQLAAEQAQQEQATREAGSRIGTGEKKPAEPKRPSGEASKLAGSAVTMEQALRREDEMRELALRDPKLWEDAAFEAEYLRMGQIASGQDPADPEQSRVIGTVHEGGRLRPLEAEPAGTYEEMPDQGVVADRPEQDAALSVARNLEAEPVMRDFLYQAANIRASGPPPDDITLLQQLTAAWPTLAERQAIDARLDDLHAAVDRLLAEQGIRPAQRARWLSELTQIEEYGPTGIKYLLGPFQQSLWERGPAAFAEAYAAVQGEAYDAEQTRIAKAQAPEAEDPTREVGRFGRP